MTIKSIWLRKIHKWVGLVIGLQFLIWAISGTAMALLPMDEVAGGETARPDGSSDADGREGVAKGSGGARWPADHEAFPAAAARPAGIGSCDERRHSPVRCRQMAGLSSSMARLPNRSPVPRILQARQ